MINARQNTKTRYYAVGKKDGSNDASYFEADSIRNYGLFGSIGNAVTFQNLTLTGKLSVSCINSSNAVMESNPFAKVGGDGGDGCSVGGLVGQSKEAVTIQNTSLNNITVNSPDICGGFVGRHAKGKNFTVERGCSYGNSTVKGKRYSGGVVGYVNAGTVSVTGVNGADSVIETRVDLQYFSGTLYGAAGGIIGYVDGSTTSVKLTNCEIIKTAVVYTANIKNTGDNVASGGLVGLTRKDLTATDCTVDGCVVLAVSNFGGGSVFPDTLKPNGTNPLSDRFKNNVVYKGENQNVANLLAWMLEQTATDINGYSVGAAGGILGVTRKSATVMLDGCTVSCVSAPSVIIAFNDAGGLIGEQRDTGANVTITDCTVKTGNYDMYIIGGPRAAGGIAYRGGGGTPTYTMSGVQITGTAECPIRILGAKYHLSDAAGLIGDINKANVTAENCKVSYCIIGGSKAAGAWSNVNSAGTTIIFNNIDINNNLIYSKNYDKNTFYAGGLFGYTNASSAVNGAYIGNNYIVGVIGAGGLVGQLLANNTLSAKYVILDDNVIRKISAKVSNFTFAASSLKDGAAANALFALYNTDFSKVGLIAGNNAGNVTAIAVSCNAPDSGETKQKNFGTGSGTGTVVYAAYGAWEKYIYGNIEGGITPQQKAIESMNLSVTTSDGSLTLNGDSVTTIDIGTAEAPNIIKTPENIVTLKWWPSYDVFSFGDTTMSNMGDLVSGITENNALPLLCLQSNTDKTMNNYLNMLTGGGFSAALKDSKVSVNIESKRYSMDKNGALTALGTAGSVVYKDGKFTAGVYDNLDLEGDNKTLTVLSITYNNVYTMHIAIYYHRSVNLKTFVIPLEGEHYYIPSFLKFDTEPTGSLKTNVSYGNPFTLYVEYDYNDLATTLEQPDNFYKQIELTNSAGNSDADAEKVKKGTQFILIDLNSVTPAGYKYYTLTLSEDTRFINFNSFTNGEARVDYIKLSALPELRLKPDERVCKDTDDCIYTERYLLAVFPIQTNTENAFTYNMKAVIDEEQRQETNIVVKSKSVYAQVSVWGSPTVEQTPTYKDNNTANKQFSNLEKPIIMNLKTEVKLSESYINYLNANDNISVFGTHILQLQNEDKSYVKLPTRTVFKVTLPDGKLIYEKELTEPTSQLPFLTGDLLGKDYTITTVEGVGTVNMEYVIELDFSGVNQEDFYKTFYASGKSTYTLVDSIYISANEGLQSGNPLKTSYQEYTVDNTSAVKLSVVPDDNRYLGININNPDDDTNNGKIGFTVSANFDSFADKEFSNVTVSFSVQKKVYENGQYKYIAPEGSEFLTWNVYKGNEVIEGNKVINSDTLTKTGNGKEYTDHYLLEIIGPFDSSDLTNYRLVVKVSATDTSGGSVEDSEYFVFLICNLNTEIS